MKPPREQSGGPDAAGDDAAGMADARVRAQIRRQMLAARKAGPLPMRVVPISMDELDAPIELDDAAPAAAPGGPATIGGYQIERELSQGGQATVLLARHQATGRQVAIKVMAGGPFITSSNRERFEREASILAQLDHPGIVGIIDKGRTSDGSFFIVMNHIGGAQLDEHLEARAKAGAPLREVVALFARIAEALQEAHARGIVHRDLKPSNIRLDARGHPHLLDFGLAHLTIVEPWVSTKLTISGDVIGSLPWASPEQARGNLRQLSPASDVYSLGVVMYLALAGRRPYPEPPNLQAMTDLILNAQPTRLDEVKQAPFGPVDTALAAIVRRCLEKDLARRYPTAGALAADLQAYLAGKPVTASHWRLDRWALAAAVLIAVLGLGLAFTTIWRDPRPTGVAAILLPTATSSTGLRFHRLPTGFAYLGSLRNESGHRDDEVYRKVSFSRPFHIATTEVTQRQYRQVMKDLPPGQSALGDNLPVERVTWHEAVEFCRRLSEIDGRPYRLPTEEEWEYACRAGIMLPYGGTGALADMGWYEGNSNWRLQPVARRSPNHWGLHDMHGNVAEWCATADPDAPPDAPRYIVRGGNVRSSAADCRAAARDRAAPDVRRAGLGFRLATDGNAVVIRRGP